MLNDIEDVAKLYYSQDMIDYNLYGALVTAVRNKPLYLVCSLFMPKFLYDRYLNYISKFCKYKVPNCSVSLDCNVVQAGSYNFLTISRNPWFGYSI